MGDIATMLNAGHSSTVLVSVFKVVSMFNKQLWGSDGHARRSET
jgi:hypothetical protein